jgi:hypothetical protein
VDHSPPRTFCFSRFMTTGDALTVELVLEFRGTDRHAWAPSVAIQRSKKVPHGRISE